MQKINTILIAILAIAVIYLVNDKFSKAEPAIAVADVSTAIEEPISKEEDTRSGIGKIAHVDLDTLNAQFTFLTDKLEVMRKEQLRQQRNFERKAQKANERYMTLQEEAYTMTPMQLEEARTEMENAELELQGTQERITNELLALETSIQKELDNRINRHLDSLNAIYGYEYILAKAAGSGVLVANDSHDLTEQIVKSLNDEYAAEKAAKTE